jgi:hypothetical protein
MPTVESIIKQWQGGEHRLAGERASELVYGADRSLNDDVLAEIRDGAPGIDAYLVAPVIAPVAAAEELPLDPDGNPASGEAPPIVPEPAADLPPIPLGDKPAEPAPAA